MIWGIDAMWGQISKLRKRGHIILIPKNLKFPGSLFRSVA
jgi:hypothetical protein